jgi:hypothetical protein
MADLGKVDLFGAFLRRSAPAAARSLTDTVAPAPAVADNVLKALGSIANGEASLSQLIDAAGGSFDALLATLGVLAGRQLVEENAGTVRLTSLGKQIADKIRTTPG